MHQTPVYSARRVAAAAAQLKDGDFDTDMIDASNTIISLERMKMISLEEIRNRSPITNAEALPLCSKCTSALVGQFKQQMRVV